jgi:hypothetical protein
MSNHITPTAVATANSFFDNLQTIEFGRSAGAQSAQEVESAEVEAIRQSTAKLFSNSAAQPTGTAQNSNVINIGAAKTTKDGGQKLDVHGMGLLKDISEEYAEFTGPGSGEVYRIKENQYITREKFISAVTAHYGVVRFTDEKGNSLPPVSAGEVWLKHRLSHKKTVHSVVMEPSSLSEGAYIEANGPEILNRWYVLKRDMAPPDMSVRSLFAIRQLVHHLLYLAGGDRVIVWYYLDWLAWLWQHPDKKIPVSIYMNSRDQRVGKGILFKLLRRLFGKELVVMGPASVLTSNFSDFVDQRLLVFIDEVDGIDRKVYEQYKHAVSEDFTKSEGKGRAAKPTLNTARYIALTNKPDGLPLMERDARQAVFKCDADRKSPDYYAKFGDWIDGPGASLLAGVLTQWKFPPDWHYKAGAPQTASSMALQQASRGTLFNVVAELIESERDPFDKDFGTVDEVSRKLETIYKHLLGKTDPNWTALGVVLRDLCGEEAKQTRVTARCGKKSKPKLYFWRHADQWKATTPEQRGAHLDNTINPRPFAVTEDHDHE